MESEANIGEDTGRTRHTSRGTCCCTGAEIALETNVVTVWPSLARCRLEDVEETNVASEDGASRATPGQNQPLRVAVGQQAPQAEDDP